MKFFITFMLVLLMMLITGLSAYILHLEQEEKLSDLSKRLSREEKTDKGSLERMKMKQNIELIKKALVPITQRIKATDSRIEQNLEPKIARNRQDIDMMTEKMDLYCHASPESSPLGRKRYPINKEKYGDTGLCGELFTADDCGQQRLSSIFGTDKDGAFVLGMELSLKQEPSYWLKTNLERLDFKPSFDCFKKDAAQCRKWIKTRALERNGLKRLKTYAQEIKYCDCINCG